jgi:hypothetical protein
MQWFGKQAHAVCTHVMKAAMCSTVNSFVLAAPSVIIFISAMLNSRSCLVSRSRRAT